MSKQNVTLDDLIDKWGIVADQDSASLSWSEMSDFFEECVAIEAKPEEVRKAKVKIISIWVAASWEEAKERRPNWKEKDWWKQRKASMEKAFGQEYKERFFEKIATAKPKQAPAPIAAEQPVAEDKMFDHIPKVTSIEEIRAWKEKRASNANG